MRRILVSLILTAGVVLVAPHAVARSAPTETLRGSCQVTNRVLSDPPLGTQLVDTEVTVSGEGACTGSLTGANGQVTFLENAPVKMYASGAGQAACTAANVKGGGVLIFGRQRIHFTYDEVRGPTGPVLLHGTEAGEAAGAPTLSEGQDPVALLEACNGTGLSEVYVDVAFNSAGISG